MKTFAILLALLLSEFVVGQTTVTVNVTNIPTDEGMVRFGLYTEGTFIKAAPDFGKSTIIKNHTCTVVFENIPAGEYAISCYQDKNLNHKFDFEPNGMPAEPYGVSNNAPSLYGPPQWLDAKFTVTNEPVSVDIRF